MTVDWIPVGERLPDYGVPVLVTARHGDEIEVLVTELTKGWDADVPDHWWVDHPSSPWIVTHWAVRPEPAGESNDR